jgi:hypothetical protein
LVKSVIVAGIFCLALSEADAFHLMLNDSNMTYDLMRMTIGSFATVQSNRTVKGGSQSIETGGWSI